MYAWLVAELDYYPPGGPSAAAAAAAPGAARQTLELLTASLAANAAETGTLALPKGYRLLRITATRAARVRLYGTAAHRAADAARLSTVDPAGDHGVMLDFLFAAGDLDWTLAPPVEGTNLDAAPANVAYYAVENRGALGAVGISFTYVKTEQ